MFSMCHDVTFIHDSLVGVGVVHHEDGESLLHELLILGIVGGGVKLGDHEIIRSVGEMLGNPLPNRGEYFTLA